MKHLFDALPRHMRTQHEETAQVLVAKVMAAVQPGDTVLIKGSLGMAMAPIVQALCGLGEDISVTSHAATLANGNGNG